MDLWSFIIGAVVGLLLRAAIDLVAAHRAYRKHLKGFVSMAGDLAVEKKPKEQS